MHQWTYITLLGCAVNRDTERASLSQKVNLPKQIFINLKRNGDEMLSTLTQTFIYDLYWALSKLNTYVPKIMVIAVNI